MKLHQRSLARWCGVLALASGCTLNVDARSVDRTATYAEPGWSTFRASVGEEASGLTVQGHATSDASVTATIGTLAPAGEQSDPLDSVSIALIPEAETIRPELQWRAGMIEGVSVLDLRAEVPALAALDLEASNAAITASGMSASVRAVTSNGGITVQTTGAVDLNTSNGPVSASGSGGSVVTSNGSVEFTWAGATPGDLSLETSNGGVVVHVPAGLGFSVNLATSNGAVDLRVDGMEFHEANYVGSFRGGGPTLTVRTSNGSIEVRE